MTVRASADAFQADAQGLVKSSQAVRVGTGYARRDLPAAIDSQ
jgi:hypothetical protein